MFLVESTVWIHTLPFLIHEYSPWNETCESCIHKTDVFAYRKSYYSNLFLECFEVRIKSKSRETNFPQIFLKSQLEIAQQPVIHKALRFFVQINQHNARIMASILWCLFHSLNKLKLKLNLRKRFLIDSTIFFRSCIRFYQICGKDKINNDFTKIHSHINQISYSCTIATYVLTVCLCPFLVACMLLIASIWYYWIIDLFRFSSIFMKILHIFQQFLLQNKWIHLNNCLNIFGVLLRLRQSSDPTSGYRQSSDIYMFSKHRKDSDGMISDEFVKKYLCSVNITHKKTKKITCYSSLFVKQFSWRTITVINISHSFIGFSRINIKHSRSHPNYSDIHSDVHRPRRFLGSVRVWGSVGVVNSGQNDELWLILYFFYKHLLCKSHF